MVTVADFVNFTSNDIKITNKSEFPLNIINYKNYVNNANESIEADKITLNKVRKGVKTLYNSGKAHCQNEENFSELLEKISSYECEEVDMDFDKISSGLCKFAVVTRDLSDKYKQLMQNLNSLIIYPLEMFLKGDLKHDMKKPFERALREYEVKSERLKRDKLNALNKESSLTIYRPNGDDLFDFSEDLERERRMVQLSLCEFLIKVSEMKARKGAELVQQLIDYYRAQTKFFQDSLSMMEHMGLFMNDLVNHIDAIKQHHSEDVQLLTGIRNELRVFIEKNKSATTTVNSSSHSQSATAQSLGSQSGGGNSSLGYSLHQPQTNKAYGCTKDGFLLKKSDGVSVFGRSWQRRRVRICDQTIMLYHGDDNKPPVVLPLLTCNLKSPVGNDAQADSLCFVLVSNNRQYNFRAEDEKSLEEWLAVLSNAISSVFEQAMSLDNDDDDDNASKENLDSGSYQNSNNNNGVTNEGYNNNNSNSNDFLLYPNIPDSMIASTMSLGKSMGQQQQPDPGDMSPGQQKKEICKVIRRVSGNQVCVDCGKPDPDWVSVNLGILICLECCGCHRELGVHNSRTQSLKMDTLFMSQLLLPRFIGNSQFNETFESLVTEDNKLNFKKLESMDKINAMKVRSTYIHQKYIEKKYVNKLNADNPAELKKELLQAIRNLDMAKLLQVYGESGDLICQFTNEDDDTIGSLMNTSIHQLLQQKQSQNGTGNGADKSSDNLCLYNLNWSDSCDKPDVMSLVLLEFILQNSHNNNLKRICANGDTILHQAVRSNNLDAVKIILRSGTLFQDLIQVKNNDLQTAAELSGVMEEALSGSQEQQDIQNRICQLLTLAQANLSHKDTHKHHHSITQQSIQQQQQQLNETLDELSIEWDIWSVPASNSQGNVPRSTSEGDDFYKKKTGSTNSTEGQISPLVTTNDLQIALRAMDEKKSTGLTSNHNRSESVGSTRSDASSYVNFNHHHGNSITTNTSNTDTTNSPSIQGNRSHNSYYGTIDNRKSTHQYSSSASNSNSGGYKHFFSMNPDLKMGITSSNHPWKDVSTLPRKKSLKGPAPEPPKHLRSKMSGHTPPILTPKPKSLDISSSLGAPTPKQRNKPPAATTKTATSNTLNYPSATLPRNMHSSTHRSLLNSSPFTTTGGSPSNSSGLHGKTGSDKPRPDNPASAKNTPANQIHSSDHIDVLLDVLEEPDRPGGAADAQSGVDSNSQRAGGPPHSRQQGGGGTANLHVRDRTIAKYNCVAENPDELSFNKGEVIIVTNNTTDSGWWEGHIESNPDRKGMFPENFVDKA